MDEVMMINIKPPEDMAPDLVKLVGRCYRENPKKTDLQELRKYLDDNPKLYSGIFNLAQVVQSKLITSILPQYPAQKSIEANVVCMRNDMNYDQSSMVERLLIENVINCWLRLQEVELHLTALSNRENSSIRVIEYWEKRLSAAQRRHLRAIETFARVRRITRSTLQVNIAEEGSQQVNVAGDLVKN